MADILNEIFINNNNWQLILKGLGLTLFIAITSIAIGIVIGSILYLWLYSGSKLAAKVIDKIFYYYSIMPTSTWYYICFYIFFTGKENLCVVAGIFAVSIDLALSIVDIVDTEVSKMNMGERDAAISMGYSKMETLKKIILPQNMRKILTLFGSRVMGTVRMTALLGLILIKDFQSMVDSIKVGSSHPWAYVIFTAFVYMSLGALFRRIVFIIRDIYYKGSESQDEIEERIKRGRV